MKLDMKAFEDEIGVAHPLMEADVISKTETALAQPPAPTFADPGRVYEEYAELIKMGKGVFQQVQYIMAAAPPDGEVIASAASMITSIKDVLREFSKLHTESVKYQRTVEMEKLKQENREKLLQLRHDLQFKEEAIDAETVPFNQEQCMRMLQEMTSMTTNLSADCMIMCSPLSGQ